MIELIEPDDDDFVVISTHDEKLVFSGTLEDCKALAKRIRDCNGECTIFKATKY
jgi:hypothetical protein